MAVMNLSEDVIPKADFHAPKGRYPIKCIAAEETTSKKGAPMLKLNWEVRDGVHTARTYDYIGLDAAASPTWARMSMQKLRALGINTEEKGLTGGALCDKLLGLEVFADLDVEAAQDANGTPKVQPDGSPIFNNKIVAYFTTNLGGASAR